MRKIYLFFTLLFPLFVNAQWEQTPGKFLSSIYSISSSGENIIAASGSMYLSTNLGTSWKLIPLNNRNVRAIAIKDSTIFAGLKDSPPSGVFKSTNLGQTWTQTTLNNKYIRSIVISGNIIFASLYEGEGLYRSTDGGNNWTASAFPSNVTQIECLAAKDNYVYAGTFFTFSGSGGLYVSSDYGATFNQSSLNYRNVTSIATDGNFVFASTSGTSPTSGVLVSSNNGANWTQTGLTSPTNALLSINGRIIAGTDAGGIKYSTNNGNSWIQTPIGGTKVYSLNASQNIIFAGMDQKGVYISSNNGNDWNQSSLKSNQINSIAVQGDKLFAGLNGGIYSSADNGANWVNNVETSSCFGLAVNGNSIYGASDYFMYYSLNGGTGWSPTGPPMIIFYSIALSKPSSSLFVFAGSLNNGVYINSGLWTQSALNNRTVWTIATSDNTILAGTENFGIYKSTSLFGQTWNTTSLDNKTVKSIIRVGNSMYAGTLNSGVYLSTNGGNNWSQTSLNNKNIYSLATDSINIFAGSDSTNSFYQSGNQGLTWTLKNEGLNATVTSICIKDNYIYVGTLEKSIFKRDLNQVGIEAITSETPNNYSLRQNYPNPFNPTTKINFSLPKQSFVTLRIFDITGREVAKLLNEVKPTGVYSVDFNGADFASGVYFYRIEASDFVDTKRMVLVK